MTKEIVKFWKEICFAEDIGVFEEEGEKVAYLKNKHWKRIGCFLINDYNNVLTVKINNKEYGIIEFDKSSHLYYDAQTDLPRVFLKDINWENFWWVMIDYNYKPLTRKIKWKTFYVSNINKWLDRIYLLTKDWIWLDGFQLDKEWKIMTTKMWNKEVFIKKLNIKWDRALVKELIFHNDSVDVKELGWIDFKPDKNK